jgi:hypothetical protein
MQLDNSISNDHIISLSPFLISFELNDSKLIEVKNAEKEVVLNLEINPLESSKIDINLKPYGEGYYELWADGELVQKVFVSSIDFPEKCIGVLHMSSNDVCEMIESIEDNVASYQVKFKAKPCFWEYRVALSQHRKIEIHSMNIDGKGFLDFEDAFDIKLAGTLDLKVFRSSETKKLVSAMAENMELVIEYSNLHSDRKSEMKITLPVPSLKEVQTEKTEDGLEAVIAPTLIYI